ncbi:MAG: hypothetical protein AB8C13_07160 [Phycisphaerales bacterium]
MRHKKLSLAIMMIASTLSAQQSAVPVKQVSAPPSDIVSGLLKLPDPESLAVRSKSALIPVTPALINGTWTWSTTLDVRDQGARVALLSAQPDTWESVLHAPERSAINPKQVARGNLSLTAGTDSLAWVAPDRQFEHISIHPNQSGQWSLTITADHNASGFVLIQDGPESTLSTYATQLSTLQDQPITLESTIDNGFTITTVSAQITSPSGIKSTETADKGSSSITIFPQEAGPYAVHITANAIDAQGNTIVRTTQNLIHAAPQAPLLNAPAIQSTESQTKFRFSPGTVNQRAILAAEVWARPNDQQNAPHAPVAWISTIVDQDRALTLDHRWITLADADPSTLELRELRIHDLESFVPVEIVDRISVPVDPQVVTQKTTKITPDMLTGQRDSYVQAQLPVSNQRGAGPGHRLMLIHGYCSSGNPFTTSHFSGDTAIFADPNQSRSHDEFALQILSQSAPMKSFGVVGHSQAGMGALHLFTFYWSGLDWARNGNRLIQTVGAPYQGTALAGNAAVLGDVFGFGCGSNDNMTYAGSANWLSTIPSAPRQSVYYYTTSFEDGFFFDYCNLVTDLLLSDPDDGVIERSAGQLPNANNMGHLEGWCHTEGMRDPAQCTDLSRNTVMNQEAKR